MLTEGEDDPHSSASSWQCKVPTCQAFYAESSQLASHYIHEHTQQLDLSIKDSAGSEMPQQSEITADSSCVEARQDPSRAGTVEAQTTCPMMSESNEGHEEVPGSIGHSSDNSSHSESRLSNSPCLKASRPMWMERSSIDQTEVKTHPTDGLDSIQEALNLPTGGAFSEMSPIVQPQGQAHEAATLANARDDASYLGRDVLSPSMDPGATLDHLSIPVSPQNRTLQIVPDHLRPACFHETAVFRDGEAMFSGDHREVEMDFNQMECDPTRTFDEEERADNSSRSPCLTIDNVELEHDNLWDGDRHDTVVRSATENATIGLTLRSNNVHSNVIRYRKYIVENLFTNLLLLSVYYWFVSTDIYFAFCWVPNVSHTCFIKKSHYQKVTILGIIEKL